MVHIMTWPSSLYAVRKQMLSPGKWPAGAVPVRLKIWRMRKDDERGGKRPSDRRLSKSGRRHSINCCESMDTPHLATVASAGLAETEGGGRKNNLARMPACLAWTTIHIGQERGSRISGLPQRTAQRCLRERLRLIPAARQASDWTDRCQNATSVFDMKRQT